MAKIGKGQNRTLSGKNPRLRVNLKELFGVDVSRRPDLREAMGQAIIDRIQDRSQKNSTDRNDKGFAKYSKSYKASDAFKAFGKTNKVNMTLRGDMLNLMDLVDEGKNTVTLGWDEDDEAAKAHGHITGNVGKTRDFFGLSEKDIKVLGRELADDISDASESAEGPEFLSLQDRILAALKELSDGQS
jgi:hypothetical protein